MERKVFKTTCPRDCFGACTMNVYVEEGKIVKVEGAEGNKATFGVTCSKGLSVKEYVYSPNRLKYPMMRVGNRGEGKFERISWETAIDKICKELKLVKEKSGPLGLMLFTSGGCEGMLSNYNKSFFTQFGGYTAKKGNLCCSAGSEAIRLTYGEVKHNAPWDAENAGLIVLWGKNPANTNVHEMKHINDAKAKGAKLITIDPIKTASTVKSDLHLSTNPGTDMALALCIINSLIQRGSLDKEFVDKYTIGFDSLRSHVLKYSIEEASKVCGLDESEINKLIEMIENSKPLTLICGVGLQRYKNGGQTIRAISMIPAITGDVGIKGGGFRFIGNKWQSLSWPFLPETDYLTRSDYPASKLAEAIEGYSDPEINMLWMERANPLVMHPDINALKAAMDKLDFIVVVDPFMTDTAKYADIVLPAQSYLEFTDIFTAGSSPYIHTFQRAIEPYYEAKNEAEIYRMLGSAMGYDMNYLPEYNDETINMVLQKSGVNADFEKLKEGPYMESHMEIAFADRRFNTPSGKIELYSEVLAEKWNSTPMPDFYSESRAEGSESYPLRFLSTHARERLHSQFADVESLNKEKPLIYINREDAENRELAEGQRVRIFNDKGEIYALVKITDTIKPGMVNVYEGLSEHTGASVNMLTDQGVTDIGWGATYYDCFVEVEAV